jgi:hypothetical protein
MVAYTYVMLPDFTASERFRKFVGEYLVDILALFGAAVVFAGGCYLAWMGSPIWMNRAGAIIVIIGIVSAVSGFPEWLYGTVVGSIPQSTKDEMAKEIAAIVGRDLLGEPLSPRQREWLDSYGKARFPKVVTSMVEGTKRRLKLYEIYLVVGGTFLHGWGDYVVCLLKNCDP